MIPDQDTGCLRPTYFHITRPDGSIKTAHRGRSYPSNLADERQSTKDFPCRNRWSDIHGRNEGLGDRRNTLLKLPIATHLTVERSPNPTSISQAQKAKNIKNLDEKKHIAPTRWHAKDTASYTKNANTNTRCQIYMPLRR